MDLSPDEEHFQGRLLHQAALWDNLELLQELIAGGAEVNARDAHMRSALHAAALAERSRCLPALCTAGADVDARSDHETGGMTALHTAAERGHVENVKALLAAGADLSVLTASGDTALALAERGRHRHAALALREAKDALERERVSQHGQLRELVVRGDAAALQTKLQELGSAAGIVANLTPGGANTLLYVASELGATTAAAALVEAGADGRAHPVTRYGPLYIACYHGHLDIAKLLLHHFPEAIQQETVEKWLPLHAACIGGHPAVVTLLLEYPYPEHLLSTYTDATGKCQYRFAFDVNARDASGQTALYVACTLGNAAVVDALLAHSVPPCQPQPASSEPGPPQTPVDSSPQRAGISLGIHAIVSKLTGAAPRNSAPAPAAAAGQRVRAVRVEAARGADSCVACAARLNHVRVLRRLLAAGARPDGTAAPPQEEGREARRRSRSASVSRTRSSASPSPSAVRAPFADDRDGPWTALAVAARAKNVQVAEILLAAGATDPGGRALREFARHGLSELLAALLATKAYPDPDYKLDKSRVSQCVLNTRDADPALSYSARCPTTPVMVNWRELRCQLSHLRMRWLVSAALRVNPRLSAAASASLALTRLELANNELRLLPRELFSLQSLRYLNAAQNKLERLPTASDPFEDEVDGRQRRGKKQSKRSAEVYTAPVLQELYLQDNRLEELPPELFSLPSLTSLDVSNNKLRALPPQMWQAPALRDLNAALNHLKELPNGDEGAPETPQSPAEPSPGASPSVHSAPFAFDQTKSTSRSPSLDVSESSHDEDDVPTIGNRAGNAVWAEARRAHEWRGARAASPQRSGAAGGSRLAALNLAHNQFSCVPPPLACRAPALARLNMAYNNLRSMSYVTSYPTSLRQLDLSHNEITCWPSLPQVENFGSSEGDPLACFCPSREARARPRSSGSVRSQLLSAACPARRHLRLEGLRTLILANNMLTRIQLTTDDDGLVPTTEQSSDENDDEWNSRGSLKARLLFPLLSMLDVSSNLLRSVPPALHLLTNLAVLNLSGNKDITDLPPQMGLLTRLWNLNTAGCALSEPLRSVVRGRSRSVDVVGYLRSVLQEARPYARMKLMVVGVQGIGKTSLLDCLRQESAIHHRRKPTDHWAKRMGNKSGRRGMSTVGVDIGAWVYEPTRSQRGPVTFRTWDFGGQQEYYATHQYFLTKRSLYLVVWKVTDGRKGLASALQWLRSIQARAPGSPVIMVGTHYDQVVNSKASESDSPTALQRLIRGAVMAAPDADKLGLPRVLDSIEVSCSTRHNIKLLADIIYSVAFSVKPPGSKEPLLEQRVPATYLALEECVHSLAADLKEPVLRHEQYKKLVTQYMQQKNLRMFRDAAELHQATMFLHENGVLLHYDDATLKELYFVRPQWLCDILAHVVTVREVNPFASNGIMRVEDLSHVFKASPALGGGEEARSLGASLLNKFELALCWDARSLLVPPLLPEREPRAPQLALKSRAWPGTPRRAALPATLSSAPSSVPSVRGTDSPLLIQEGGGAGGAVVSARKGARALRRLLLLSYVPRGFWARLCARVLADPALALLAPALYCAPREMDIDESVAKALDFNWSWKLWKTGLKLVCGELVLLALRELPPRYDPLLGAVGDEDEPDELYHSIRFRVRAEGTWSELDVQSSACVELLLPAQVCVVRRDDGLPLAGCQSLSLEPNPEVLTKVLALVSDHVDLLLEDWYPSLGTRFVHTSEGRCLITRVAPCPACLADAQLEHEPHHDHDKHFAQVFRRLDLGSAEPRRLRLSEESRASDGDSGVGAESNTSSRVGSTEGVCNSPSFVATCWTLEECVLAACTSAPLCCPHHADVQLADVAPDTLLLDVEEDKRARWEHITRTAVAGRGAFGTVLTGTWRRPGAKPVPVAVKALQPVAPPSAHDIQAMQAYKAAASRWERDATGGACRAYCGLRQELGILARLRHAHVLPLLAACPAPLALLLAVAPQGSLEGALRRYRGCGKRVGDRAARALALQVARALEYLHAHRVLYRDLKSENVLVWSLPAPQEAEDAELSPDPIDVHVKLGDYGISRLAPPSGTKGFGGTEGFMAPEIMRYNGEEEYTEKVDCFSYGMLLYEIFTLRQPFEGHEAVKEAVLEGARPPLSPRDLQYPCSLLETMRRCWSGAPELRPSAGALTAVCAAPECLALRDAAAARPAAAAAAAPLRLAEGDLGWEVWYGGAEPERAHTLTISDTFQHHHSLRVPPDKTEPVIVTAMCRVGPHMWLGDSVGRIFVYTISTCALSWSVRLQDVVGGAPSAVAALELLAPLPRVAVALACGRLFIVTSERQEEEGSFVLTELGAATELSCLAAVPVDDSVSLWAGGPGLHAYAVRAEGVSAAEQLAAPARLALLRAAPRPLCVLGAARADVFVFSWSARSRRPPARLDCSKLVPCSESLQSIAIDDSLGHERCRVTALAVIGDQVLVGTAWGCLVVAHAASLLPLTVFRPYEEEVRAIVPLPPLGRGARRQERLVTFGAGYRPLVQRYAPAQSNNTTTFSGFYCLLWTAQHWLPD
ncbi:leucine-rich repeat serine/threonine-protein kinase 1 [Melitaea cinxia]|uniref:leucine-rich repeat serine/threonine-protein kinase 1 n=1 Tax=Melitaea cinxia TaxID=113334 RepID=UPI001E26E8EF|nr:leucine-rich repeat serine/threonine-protein kinase 1 [Melitaea cinxia]